jgi:hypothetical protein
MSRTLSMNCGSGERNSVSEGLMTGECLRSRRRGAAEPHVLVLDDLFPLLAQVGLLVLRRERRHASSSASRSSSTARARRSPQSLSGWRLE